MTFGGGVGSGCTPGDAGGIGGRTVTAGARGGGGIGTEDRGGAIGREDRGSATGTDDRDGGIGTDDRGGGAATRMGGRAMLTVAFGITGARCTVLRSGTLGGWDADGTGGGFTGSAPAGEGASCRACGEVRH